MRTINYLMVTSAAAVMLCLAANNGMAQNDQGGGRQRQGGGRQGRGNFDPAQFQQRMMDRYRDRLEITDDAEWKAIQPLIQKVMEARTALGTGRGGFGRGNRRGGETNPTAPAPRRNPAAENPAADELQKAIDSKAAPPDMKAALTKYVEYRKAKQADLDKARDALRAVLTSRQEAIATLSGLL